MTDNTNIEALPELPESGMDGYMGEPAYSADQMREYGLLCRRAALSNAEPVMFAFRHLDGTLNDASETMHSKGMVPLFLHPSVPAPYQHTQWHAPGLGEVHYHDHKYMIECMKDYESASEPDVDYTGDDGLAKHVAEALNAFRPFIDSGEQG